MITQPQIITGIANGFSSLFVSQLVPEIQTPPPVEPSSGGDISETDKEGAQEGKASSARGRLVVQTS